MIACSRSGSAREARSASSLSAATRELLVGVDHSAVMLRQARRRNAAAVRAGRVVLRLGSAESLPVFDAPFDKIIAVNSLLFWDDPVARLSELDRCLRPGGTIAIAFQPRGPGADDETTARAGREIAQHLAAAGLREVRGRPETFGRPRSSASWASVGGTARSVRALAPRRSRRKDSGSRGDDPTQVRHGHRLV